MFNGKQQYQRLCYEDTKASKGDYFFFKMLADLLGDAARKEMLCLGTLWLFPY